MGPCDPETQPWGWGEEKSKQGPWRQRSCPWDKARESESGLRGPKFKSLQGQWPSLSVGFASEDSANLGLQIENIWEKKFPIKTFSLYEVLYVI